MKMYKILKTKAGYEPEILDSTMCLSEAYRELLDFFNRRFDMQCPNWGAAVLATRGRADGAVATFADGTRCFTYDTYSYRIEPNAYRVADHASGNYVIYEGDDLDEAKQSILDAIEGEEDDAYEDWDLYCDGDRIWCGSIHTLEDLRRV